MWFHDSCFSRGDVRRSVMFIALHFRDGVQGHVQCQKSWQIVLGFILTLYINSDLIRGRLSLARPSCPFISSSSSSSYSALSRTVSPLSHIWTLQISVGLSLCSANLRREKLCQQSNPAKSWTSAGGSHLLLSHCEMLPQQGEGGPDKDSLCTKQTTDCPNESPLLSLPAPVPAVFFSLKQ